MSDQTIYTCWPVALANTVAVNAAKARRKRG